MDGVSVTEIFFHTCRFSNKTIFVLIKGNSNLYYQTLTGFFYPIIFKDWQLSILMNDICQEQFQGTCFISFNILYEISDFFFFGLFIVVALAASK